MGLFSILGEVVIIAVAESIAETKRKEQTISETTKVKNFNKKHQEFLSHFEYAMERVINSPTPEDISELLMSLVMVGMACAKSDGQVSVEEKKEINQFIDALIHVIYEPGEDSTDLEMVFMLMWKEDLNVHSVLKNAIKVREQLNLSSMDLFTSMIEFIIHSDGIVHPKELEFMQMWKNSVQQYENQRLCIA